MVSHSFGGKRKTYSVVYATMRSSRFSSVVMVFVGLRDAVVGWSGRCSNVYRGMRKGIEYGDLEQMGKK